MNNKFPNRGSFQSFGLFLSKKKEARGSRRYGQPAKLLAAAGGPARPIHPSTYQSRAQLLAHDRPMPQSSSPFVGPTVGGGPYALASSGLRSTENRVHGGTPSLLPPLIVVAGLLLLLPALQTHRPAGPTCWLSAASRLPRGRCMCG